MKRLCMQYGQMRLLILAASLVCLPTFADSVKEFYLFAEAELEKFNVPGASIAIVDNGAVQYLNFGLRNSESSATVTSSDLFHIASISKPVTAWALMKLTEQNHVSLDEPVRKYLKTWQLPPSEYDNDLVTLRKIMSHTAGLSARSYQGFPASSPLPTLQDSLNGIPISSSAVVLINEPGSTYGYSGGGFTLAQLLIEDVTGTRFRTYMEETLFKPLNMQHATYKAVDMADDNAVKPHDFAGRMVENYVLAELAAGGLRASAKDLVQFAIANMRPNPVLRDESVQQLHEVVVQNGPNLATTLGFERRNGLISHGGQNRGWNSWLDIDPSRQSALIVLTNGEGGFHLINPIRCKWDSLFAINKLDNYCDGMIASQKTTRWILTTVTVVALSAAIMILFNLLKGFRENRNELKLSVPRVVFCTLCLLAISVLWLVLGTDFGVYLFAGIRWGFPTIEYLPAQTWHFALSLTALVAACMSRASFRQSSA